MVYVIQNQLNLKTSLTEDNIHLKYHITEHVKYTNSNIGKRMLSDWRNQVSHFIKVMPTEYKRALEKIVKEKKLINRLK